MLCFLYSSFEPDLPSSPKWLLWLSASTEGIQTILPPILRAASTAQGLRPPPHPRRPRRLGRLDHVHQPREEVGAGVDVDIHGSPEKLDVLSHQTPEN